MGWRRAWCIVLASEAWRGDGKRPHCSSGLVGRFLFGMVRRSVIHCPIKAAKATTVITISDRCSMRRLPLRVQFGSIKLLVLL